MLVSLTWACQFDGGIRISPFDEKTKKIWTSGHGLDFLLVVLKLYSNSEPTHCRSRELPRTVKFCMRTISRRAYPNVQETTKPRTSTNVYNVILELSQDLPGPPSALDNGRFFARWTQARTEMQQEKESLAARCQNDDSTKRAQGAERCDPPTPELIARNVNFTHGGTRKG